MCIVQIKKKKKIATATRTIYVVDSIAPELKLNGNSEINIAKDSNYQELGCIATDNYYLKGLITNTLHKTKKFQHFKEDDVWVKTNQYVNIDGEKYELP